MGSGVSRGLEELERLAGELLANNLNVLSEGGLQALEDADEEISEHVQHLECEAEASRSINGQGRRGADTGEKMWAEGEGGVWRERGGGVRQEAPRGSAR